MRCRCRAMSATAPNSIRRSPSSRGRKQTRPSRIGARSSTRSQ
jgi:hypothetical protein